MTPVPKEPEAAVLALEGREVRVTHPDKLYFSRQARLTKLDLVRYFLSIAPGALGGIRDRPLVLKRFVDGAEGAPFYQKRAPSARPEWLRTVRLAFPSGRTAEELVVDDAAGLAFVVNLGCIELHPHPVRTGNLDHPDELRIDLDPTPGVAWAAKACRASGSWNGLEFSIRRASGTPFRIAAQASSTLSLMRAVRLKQPKVTKPLHLNGGGETAGMPSGGR